MTDRLQSGRERSAGVLEHLTGPSRGYVAWLAEPLLSVFVGEDRLLHVRADPVPLPGETRVGGLSRDGSSYRLTPVPGIDIWVNRSKSGPRTLHHGDTIEFGETGPISRFRLFEDRTPLRWPVGEVLGDSFSYFRFSRRPLGVRLVWACGEALRRLVTDTTVLFRVTILLALAVLAVVAVLQYRTSLELRESLAREERRIEGLEAVLARARAEALQPGDLAALREELTARMTSARDRILELERDSAMAARVIEAATRSVVLLQGAYGLRHVESDRMLRHVLGPRGNPVFLPSGQPFLSLEGDGPVAEVHFTGTAFVLAGTGQLVSNRHVAVPWETDADMERLSAQEMEPVILQFIGFLPDQPEPLAVTLDQLSDEADLALLSMAGIPEDGRGLTLAGEIPRPGEEVIVMGYPTGLRSLLAQAGRTFVDELQQTEDTDFWSVARRLADAGLIAPLASRGIVGQAGAQAVVYDAETTHGGSGGPVLNTNGEVIAVNAAILPDFGGANIGVPVERLRALLEPLGE